MRGCTPASGSLAASSRIRRAGAGLSKLNSMLARAPHGAPTWRPGSVDMLGPAGGDSSPVIRGELPAGAPLGAP
jgi:hypothetical protein